MNTPRNEQHGRVRIIGGQWKKRIIRFRGSNELRPTPDSVRETVFNWLAPHISGARCLDLFSGSGALGFEAASRGAASVTLVENQFKTWRQLQDTINLLNTSTVVAEHADALDWLTQCRQQFNLVFVDPPYCSGLVDKALARLIRTNCLRTDANIYTEYRIDEKPTIPIHWELLRQKKAGQVCYSLYRHTESSIKI